MKEENWSWKKLLAGSMAFVMLAMVLTWSVWYQYGSIDSTRLLKDIVVIGFLLLGSGLIIVFALMKRSLEQAFPSNDDEKRAERYFKIMGVIAGILSCLIIAGVILVLVLLSQALPRRSLTPEEEQRRRLLKQVETKVSRLGEETSPPEQPPPKPKPPEAIPGHNTPVHLDKSSPRH